MFSKRKVYLQIGMIFQFKILLPHQIEFKEKFMLFILIAALPYHFKSQTDIH